MVNTSDRILIMVDEAHRTQGSDMGNNLFEAFPNAARVAFTGTPLITERHGGKRTVKRFGEYIDTYKLMDLVADGATLQILYEGRTANTALREKAEFDAAFEDLFARFGGNRRLIRDAGLAPPSGLGDRKDQSDVGGIDILAPRQPDRPLETALAQSLTERPAGAVSRIGEDATEARARGDDAINLLDRAFRLSFGTRARAMRSGSFVQSSGRNSRRPTITGTSRDASVSETSD